MFSLYDLSELTIAETTTWLENTIHGATHFYDEEPRVIEPNLTGLSSGEIRQALLDYARQDFGEPTNNQHGRTHSHGQRALQNFRDMLTIPEETNDILNTQPPTTQTFDNALYSLPDKNIEGIWVFDNRGVYITNDETT